VTYGGSVLFVATSDGIRSPDGGTELGGQPVRALARDRNGWWALVGSHEVYGRPDGGGWAPRARSDEQLTCVAPVEAGLLVGAAGARLHLLDTSGSLQPVESFDRAPGREDWYTPWGGPPDSRSLAVAGDGTLYVNVHVGGVLRSTDQARTWAPTIDLHADVHQVICPRPYQPQLVLVACADGLAVSEDAGQTWLLREVGLRRTYCRAVAVAGETVLVSSSDGPGGSHAAVYRAPLKGYERFERCWRGLPEWFEGNIDTGWLVGTGDLAAFVAPDGRLYRSVDEGAAWEQVGEELGEPSWLLVT
jgi:hypothetical protein